VSGLSGDIFGVVVLVCIRWGVVGVGRVSFYCFFLRLLCACLCLDVYVVGSMCRALVGFGVRIVLLFFVNGTVLCVIEVVVMICCV